MTRFDPFFALLDAVPVPDDAEYLYDAATPDGALRRGNLARYLRLVAARDPDTVLVGEAPGYRGMTVTGEPFHSIRELAARPGRLSGAADGDGYRVPDGDLPEWEPSSGIVQRAIASWARPPVLWAVSPHHPFRAGAPDTNRAPRAAEVRSGAPVALELIRAFDPRRVIAVGRTAQGALAAAGVAAVSVRHPAQGGAAEFTAGMAALAA